MPSPDRQSDEDEWHLSHEKRRGGLEWYRMPQNPGQLPPSEIEPLDDDSLKLYARCTSWMHNGLLTYDLSTQPLESRQPSSYIRQHAINQLTPVDF